MNIAVAGTGYVGLSLAVLLSQHNHVTAVDILSKKVEMLNNWKSPIQDDYIEKFLAEHEERKLDLTATTDAAFAYSNADYVIIAAPTNYDPQKNFFDCSAVESVIELVLKSSSTAIMVIKSTIPVGYTKKVREKFNTHIIQEFKGGDNCETAKANNIDNSWICFHHCRLPLFPSSRHRDIYHHRLPGHIYCCGFLSGISSE